MKTMIDVILFLFIMVLLYYHIKQVKKINDIRRELEESKNSIEKIASNQNTLFRAISSFYTDYIREKKQAKKQIIRRARSGE